MIIKILSGGALKDMDKNMDFLKPEEKLQIIKGCNKR